VRIVPQHLEITCQQIDEPVCGWLVVLRNVLSNVEHVLACPSS
jgi:hypothetical protein